MNRLEKKTMATLLIAIFMISTLAVAYTGAVLPGEHLVADGTQGNEDRIIIPMPEGFLLSELTSISWGIFTVAGYPAHVDIILDDDVMLTAEQASNNDAYEHPPDGPYGGWLKTFELEVNDGCDEVNDATILHVGSLGAGTYDAPSGTLAQWKAGSGATPGEGDLEEEVPDTTGAIVTRLEIEVDNWIVDTEAYVRNIQVNGVSTDLRLEVVPPIVSIMVSPASVNFGKIKYGVAVHEVVTVFNIGDIRVDVTVDTHPTDGFFDTYLTISNTGKIFPSASRAVSLDLTVPYEHPAGIYTGYLVFTATPVFPT